MKQNNNKTISLILKASVYLMCVLSLLSGALVMIASNYIDATPTQNAWLFGLILLVCLLINLGVPGLLFILISNESNYMNSNYVCLFIGLCFIFFLNGLIATTLLIKATQDNFLIGLVLFTILVKLTYMPYLLIKTIEQESNNNVR